MCDSFFFNDTATTEIYTLSLHDALPIYTAADATPGGPARDRGSHGRERRSEEHTSELQSRFDLVCRLLLEKKKSSSNATSAFTATHLAAAASTVTWSLAAYLGLGYPSMF